MASTSSCAAWASSPRRCSRPPPGRRIDYVTDLRCAEANLRALDTLCGGVDTLLIENVFFDADRAQADRKNHLTARQAGEFARRLGARFVAPFHFSPRYGVRVGEVLEEVRRQWAVAAAAGAGEAEHWTCAMR